MKGLQLIASLLFLFSSVIFTSCKKKASDVKPAPEANSNIVNESRELYNVSYGTHERQKMDVYFPKGYTDKTPVVFLIHGGGFVAGSKEDFTLRAQTFRSQGYIVVNISYRLADTTGLLSTPIVHKVSNIKVSDELADVKSAVDKYISMSAEWKARTGKMYMAGHSAGAILAMLYTQGKYNENGNIRACANWAGVTDMSIPHDSLVDDLDPRYRELLYRITGVEPATKNNLYYMAISPYWVLNNGTGKPTITIYPENNTVLNSEWEADWGLMNTQNYHKLLQKRGIAEKLSIYKGNDHGFSNQGSWEKLIGETAEFFNDK
jgi:acetyl esterase/lipase